MDCDRKLQVFFIIHIAFWINLIDLNFSSFDISINNVGLKTFELIPSFEFNLESIERQSNGKGEYKNRGNKKILNIKYTPDFIGKDFIIETKGRANESFPIRWKLFKRLLIENNFITQQPVNWTLYKPQNQKECDETIRLILLKQNTQQDVNTESVKSTNGGNGALK